MAPPAGAPVRKWSPALPLLPDGRGLIAGSLSGAGPPVSGHRARHAVGDRSRRINGRDRCRAHRVAPGRQSAPDISPPGHDPSPLRLGARACTLRARLPADLPLRAAEAWLDQQVHGWRDHLPLRFSVGALEALIRPALQTVRGEALRAAGPLCRRELRRRADGTGWAAYVGVSSGAQLPARFLPGVETTLRLRFLVLGSDHGPPAAFLGVPEGGGWRLARTGAASEIALRLDRACRWTAGWRRSGGCQTATARDRARLLACSRPARTLAEPAGAADRPGRERAQFGCGCLPTPAPAPWLATS